MCGWFFETSDATRSISNNRDIGIEMPVEIDEVRKPNAICIFRHHKLQIPGGQHLFSFSPIASATDPPWCIEEVKLELELLIQLQDSISRLI